MSNMLKVAIIEAATPQYEIARKSKILSETRLSRLATGRAVATPAEQEALSKVLGKPISSLFGVKEGAR